MPEVCVSCSKCNFIGHVHSEDLDIVFDVSERVESVYRFNCPSEHLDGASQLVVKPCGKFLIDALINVGCEVVIIDSTIPEEDFTNHDVVLKKLGEFSIDEEINFGLLSPAELDEAFQTELNGGI
jgi:hypothetical protein